MSKYSIPMREAFVVAKFVEMDEAQACKREGDTIEVDKTSTAKDKDGNLKQVHLKRPIKTVGELVDFKPADDDFDAMTVHDWRVQVGLGRDDALKALRTGCDLTIRSMQENAVTKPGKISQRMDAELRRNGVMAKVLADANHPMFAQTLAKIQGAVNPSGILAKNNWLDEIADKV